VVKIGIEDLYSDIILDYAKNNKYRKEIPASQKAEGRNLSCGDEITIFLKVDNGKIVEASYLGHGCIISQASAAMMCEIIEGKSVEEAEKILNEVIKMSQGKEYDKDLIDGMKVFSDISNFPMRIKCFTLSWHTLEDAINKQD
jgi:nitrogen fixation NifU-like protein